MGLPGFDDVDKLDSYAVRARLSDRVRAERLKLNTSQTLFAQWCGVSVRTYKRFELNECDSLEVFLKIVSGLGRLGGLEGLFPAQPFRSPPQTVSEAMDQLKFDQNAAARLPRKRASPRS
jgi:hypothetical protein